MAVVTASSGMAMGETSSSIKAHLSSRSVYRASSSSSLKNRNDEAPQLGFLSSQFSGLRISIDEIGHGKSISAPFRSPIQPVAHYKQEEMARGGSRASKGRSMSNHADSSTREEVPNSARSRVSPMTQASNDDLTGDATRTRPGQIRHFPKMGPTSFLEGQVRTKIGSIVKANLPEAYAQWSDWSPTHKEDCWGKFLEIYQFKDEDLNHGKKLFESYLSQNYRKWMATERKNAAKKYGGDLSKARNDFPSWIGLAKWQKLCDKWLSEDWARKSIASKQNRASKMMVTHTCGSKPVEQLKAEMFESLKRPPSHLEVFESTHVNKKTKEWSCKIAKTYAEVYKNRLLERNVDAPVEKQYEDPNLEIWKDIVSVKKNRLLGFGERTKFKTTF